MIITKTKIVRKYTTDGDWLMDLILFDLPFSQETIYHLQLEDGRDIQVTQDFYSHISVGESYVEHSLETNDQTDRREDPPIKFPIITLMILLALGVCFFTGVYFAFIY